MENTRENIILLLEFKTKRLNRAFEKTKDEEARMRIAIEAQALNKALMMLKDEGYYQRVKKTWEEEE